MDLYVQEFGVAKTHDEFYTNMVIRGEFYKYVQFVVSRYVNEPGIIAWELANDARCNSTLPSSDLCNTNTVTLWHAETAKFIRSIDPNHLITPGCASILLLPDDLLNSHPQQDPWLLLSNMPQVVLASTSTSTATFARSRKYS
jgi:endo-1,4-beta-mannosidase